VIGVTTELVRNPVRDSAPSARLARLRSRTSMPEREKLKLWRSADKHKKSAARPDYPAVAGNPF